ENLATVQVQTLDHVGKPLLRARGLILVDLLRERGCHRVTRNNHVTGGGGVTRRDVVALENVEPERTTNLTVPQPLRGTGGVHADEQIRLQELPVERGRDDDPTALTRDVGLVQLDTQVNKHLNGSVTISNRLVSQDIGAVHILRHQTREVLIQLIAQLVRRTLRG